MEQFSLETWLQDKSRKVFTRDGRLVRIICTDRKARSGNIVGLVGEDESIIYVWQNDGTHAVSGIDANDLFFADEEKELTEFEKAIYQYICTIVTACDGEVYGDKELKPIVKEIAKALLDLARKELLKNLPKWKKTTEKKDLEKHVAILEDGKVLLSNYLEEGDCYIELDDLKTLPKEN